MTEGSQVCHVAQPDLALARTLAANARGFLRATPEDAYHDRLQDRYHRLAIALELALKSYLASRGYTDAANRRIGHDLRRAADTARAEGLALHTAIERLIDDAHPFFMEGGFHRQRRNDWSRDRADRATIELEALVANIAAPSGAR